MEQILSDYKAYYAARSQRYENLPHFTRTLAAEQQLAHCVISAATWDDWAARQEEMKKLSDRATVAYLHDQAAYRKAIYEELEHSFKVQIEKSLLDEIQGDMPANEAIVKANTLLDQGRNAIILDETWPQDFWSDVPLLERIEVWERAPFSEAYRYRQQRAISMVREALCQRMQDRQKQMEPYQPGWMPDYEALWAPRHRRHFPVSDNRLRQLIEAHKAITQVQ